MAHDKFSDIFRQLALFPNSKIRVPCPNKFLIWEARVQPFYFTSCYTLCINYEREWAPRVWIVEPDFSVIPNLPHVYKGKTNMLCLYHSNDWSWANARNIVKTFVLWSQMWIFYYEDYAKTGNWRGPEAAHESEKVDQVNPQRGTPGFLRDYPIRIK